MASTPLGGMGSCSLKAFVPISPAPRGGPLNLRLSQSFNPEPGPTVSVWPLEGLVQPPLSPPGQVHELQVLAPDKPGNMGILREWYHSRTSRPPLLELHPLQEGTMFSMMSFPPLLVGIRWSLERLPEAPQ